MNFGAHGTLNSKVFAISYIFFGKRIKKRIDLKIAGVSTLNVINSKVRRPIIICKEEKIIIFVSVANEIYLFR